MARKKRDNKAALIIYLPSTIFLFLIGVVFIIKGLINNDGSWALGGTITALLGIFFMTFAIYGDQ